MIFFFFFFSFFFLQSDLSDVYAFQSSATTTTLIMNVSPMQRSDNGPSYTPLDDRYFYQFHIDNDGDRIEDITFQFRVGSTLLAPENPLTIVGPLSAASNGDVHTGTNQPEHWELRVMNGEDYNTPFSHGPLAARVGDGKTKFGKPVDFVGETTFPGAVPANTYKAYADQFIQNIKFPGCATQGKVFVGPRRESFAIDLGSVFDLFSVHVNTDVTTPPSEENIQNSAACTAIQSPDKNTLDCSTVVSFVIEIPTTCLVKSGTVIGAWASVREIVHADAGDVAGEQFTRLGNPLINEIFIGLADKDKFGKSHPKNDGQWLKYITHPTFPAIFEGLFPALSAPSVPRNDLKAILFTGIPGFNLPTVSRKRSVESSKNSSSDSISDSSSDSDEINSIDIVKDAPLQALKTPAAIKPEPSVAPLEHVADILRLNTVFSPTATPGSMGVFDIDFAGFPNGRRLGDDVVDIYLRAAMGRACDSQFLADLGAAVPSVASVITSVCPTIDPTTAAQHFTDRAPISASSFQATFPFLNIPVPGSHLRECHEGDADIGRQSKPRNAQNGCTTASKDPSCHCEVLPMP
jgi:hypothetical protein